jgi:hypothetical protein
VRELLARPNRTFWWIAAAALLVLMMSIYIAPIAAAFQFGAPSPAIAIAAMLASIIVVLGSSRLLRGAPSL